MCVQQRDFPETHQLGTLRPLAMFYYHLEEPINFKEFSDLEDYLHLRMIKNLKLVCHGRSITWAEILLNNKFKFFVKELANTIMS